MWMTQARLLVLLLKMLSLQASLLKMLSLQASLSLYWLLPGRAPSAAPLVKIAPLPMPPRPSVNVPELVGNPVKVADCTTTPGPVKIALAKTSASSDTVIPKQWQTDIAAARAAMKVEAHWIWLGSYLV